MSRRPTLTQRVEAVEAWLASIADQASYDAEEFGAQLRRERELWDLMVHGEYVSLRSGFYSRPGRRTPQQADEPAPLVGGTDEDASAFKAIRDHYHSRPRASVPEDRRPLDVAQNFLHRFVQRRGKRVAFRRGVVVQRQRPQALEGSLPVGAKLDDQGRRGGGDPIRRQARHLGLSVYSWLRHLLNSSGWCQSPHGSRESTPSAKGGVDECGTGHGE